MFIISILCWLSAHFHIVLSNCSDNAVSTSQDFCVHIEPQKLGWSGAQEFCKQRGGNLTSVNNAFDNSMIANMAISTSCNDYWIGATCSGTTCKWQDGSEFKYSNWKSGQPDGNACVSVSKSTGKWSTQSCDQQSCFACESNSKMSDCKDWRLAGYLDDGEYDIDIDGTSHTVYCDMTTDGGGWTVFQRREDNSTVFWNRTWDEYKKGFGSGMQPGNNFWLGNDALHTLSTKDQNVTLRIEMRGDGTPNAPLPDGYWWTHYYEFTVGSEADSYPLHVTMSWPNFQGNASTGWYDMTCSNGAPFSTVDRINDPYKDCITKFQMGGWWLHNCAMSTLNGAYIPKDWNNAYGIFWIVDGLDNVIHPRHTVMMLRRTT